MSLGKILLVDDSEMVKDILEEALSEADYELVWLSSPMLLPMKVQEEKPDILLLDVNIPVLRGDRAFEIASERGVLTGIPVLFHSSRPKEELAAMVEKSGADGYIEKGCADDELIKQIAHWVGVSRQRRTRS